MPQPSPAPLLNSFRGMVASVAREVKGIMGRCRRQPAQRTWAAVAPGRRRQGAITAAVQWRAVIAPFSRSPDSAAAQCPAAWNAHPLARPRFMDARLLALLGCGPAAHRSHAAIARHLDQQRSTTSVSEGVPPSSPRRSHPKPTAPRATIRSPRSEIETLAPLHESRICFSSRQSEMGPAPPATNR